MEIVESKELLEFDTPAAFCLFEIFPDERSIHDLASGLKEFLEISSDRVEFRLVTFVNASAGLQSPAIHMKSVMSFFSYASRMRFRSIKRRFSVVCARVIDNENSDLESVARVRCTLERPVHFFIESRIVNPISNPSSRANNSEDKTLLQMRLLLDEE